MADASEDDDLISISALQHFAFCERQCALIHAERIWTENELTAEGRVVHERVDLPGVSDAGRVARAIHLRSDRLGLIGRADVVEFLPPVEADGPEVPFPVEFKRGHSTGRLADRVQLCAQAMALEEMTGVEVPRGALFYHASRRRVLVEFDAELRAYTEDIAFRVRAMIQSESLPKAQLLPKCSRCSLREACQPAKSVGDDAGRFLEGLVGEQGRHQESE